MYLLYEHHKDPEGKLLVTDMLMSSYFPGKPGINFKRPQEAAFFEFTKKTFKGPHISQRSYDPETNIWSFFASVGAGVYKALKDSPMAAIGLHFEKIEDLAGQVRAGYVAKPEKAFAFDPSDFFYTPEAPKSIGPSKADAESKLASLMLMDLASLRTLDAKELKRAYLKTAMKLHPDRPENGGDTSRMTELNYYWQVLQGASK